MTVDEQSEPDPLIRNQVAAAIMGTSTPSIYRWQQKGVVNKKTGGRAKLRSLRIGSILKTRRSWINQFIAELNAEPTDVATTAAKVEVDAASDREAEEVRKLLGSKTM